MRTKRLNLVVLRHPSLRGIRPTPMSRKKEHNRVVPLDVRVLDQELVKLFEDLALRRLFVGEEDDLGGWYTEDAGQEVDKTLTIASASSQVTECLDLYLYLSMATTSANMRGAAADASRWVLFGERGAIDSW